MIEDNAFKIAWIMLIVLFLLTGLFYIIMELIFNKTKSKKDYKHLEKKRKKINVYRQNRPAIHPVLIFIIILAAYSFVYISRNIDQIPTGAETVSSSPRNENNETIQTSNFDRTPANDSKTLENKIIYDISYSDLNDDEKNFYDKILSTAMNKDNTFITDRELTFIFNTPITENEAIRVHSVLYNNYPDVKFYTTRDLDAWICYVTHFMNGVPLYKTYYFNVKYN